MADRFPSLDDFSSDAIGAQGDSQLDLGPDADFLAREKAALGDDADFFASPNDKLHVSGTVHDVDDNDLLGGGESAMDGEGAFGGSEMSDFQSSFPAIDNSNAQVGPGGTITGNNEPFLTNVPAPTSSDHVRADDEGEREPVRQWREQRALALEHRDQLSESRKQETIKAARAAIDDFYENYNAKKEKNIAQTRKEAESFLASREDTSAGGTSWERIAKLVDLSGKGARGGATGTGKERFRELLLSLKKDDKAPGATGY